MKRYLIDSIAKAPRTIDEDGERLTYSDGVARVAHGAVDQKYPGGFFHRRPRSLKGVSTRIILVSAGSRGFCNSLDAIMQIVEAFEDGDEEPQDAAMAQVVFDCVVREHVEAYQTRRAGPD